ncbi:integrase core domain [Elysia marginata]|uniref:Integrase core domain n=1 Tax=Elysia marginata TaxID=1093978 RepID=A0AAV4EJT4_9GAST|nr:integrase core domain [Elysia marginata]
MNVLREEAHFDRVDTIKTKPQAQTRRKSEQHAQEYGPSQKMCTRCGKSDAHKYCPAKNIVCGYCKKEDTGRQHAGTGRKQKSQAIRADLQEAASVSTHETPENAIGTAMSFTASSKCQWQSGTISADCKEAMEQVRRQVLSNPRLQHHSIGKHQVFTGTCANGKKAQKPTAIIKGTLVMNKEMFCKKYYKTKEKQKFYYDRKARTLKPLGNHTPVRLQPPAGSKVWTPARITGKLGLRHNYAVTSEEGTFRRNRRHIIKSTEQANKQHVTSRDAVDDEAENFDSKVNRGLPDTSPPLVEIPPSPSKREFSSSLFDNVSLRAHSDNASTHHKDSLNSQETRLLESSARTPLTNRGVVKIFCKNSLTRQRREDYRKAQQKQSNQPRDKITVKLSKNSLTNQETRLLQSSAKQSNQPRDKITVKLSKNSLTRQRREDYRNAQRKQSYEKEKRRLP